MMELQDEMHLNDVVVQQVDDAQFKSLNIQLNVLRLDKIHAVVSGNKWFKLKYYLQHAVENNYSSIATFGGAFSNHILATAYACYKQKIQCTGFIRGEQSEQLSQTLLDAEALNMQLEFVSREAYKNKEAITRANPGAFFIPEGGYGIRGARGASEILRLVPDLSAYNYIVCAVGRGTMLAGIANASLPHQQCIGISAMKNNFSLEKEMNLLIDNAVAKHVTLIHDYHFGGYAKYTQQLIDFINNTWMHHHLPLDFVYTAKALHAVYDLAEKNYFAPGSNIIFIHSGGLQGNRSLSEKPFLFSND